MYPQGVRFLDHTADVGVEVEAPSLDALLHRCALGMMALIRSEDDGDAAEPAGLVTDRVPLVIDADGPAGLLAHWLREVLYLHDGRGLDYLDAEFDAATEMMVRATVRATAASGAVREIKGVTYHELTVERTDRGWRASVIFDV